MTQHQSQETHSRKKDEHGQRQHRQHYSHNTDEAHAEKRPPKSPSKVGCFQRPKLPDEIKAQAAVRDDLGRNLNFERIDLN